MSIKKRSRREQARRRYRNDQPIEVTELDTGNVGVLPAHSLIRNETPPASPRAKFRVFFEASTDNGQTWSRCASSERFVTFKA